MVFEIKALHQIGMTKDWVEYIIWKPLGQKFIKTLTFVHIAKYIGNNKNYFFKAEFVNWNLSLYKGIRDEEAESIFKCVCIKS